MRVTFKPAMQQVLQPLTRSMRFLRSLSIPIALASTALFPVVTAHAQGAFESGIYSCVDASGKRLTSDRPIPACNDREQRLIGPTGVTRAIVGPTYTAREQAAREDKAREAERAELRKLEERRRERALLIRYPNPKSHETARSDALEQIDAVLGAARKRVAELMDERRSNDAELEFYGKDVSKAPPSLQRQIEDNTRSVAVQNRFIGEQEDEKRRVNGRFDEESLRLRALWAANGVSSR